MAKKEKIVIQRDKTLEPIDNELDAAMGLLEAANRQITDLLTSLEGGSVPTVTPGAAELEDGATEPSAPSEAAAESTAPAAESSTPAAEADAPKEE